MSAVAVAEPVPAAFELNASRAELLPLLMALNEAAPKHPPVPILAGVLIDALNGTLSTFDYETTVTASINGFQGYGLALIPFAPLLAAVKAGPRNKLAMAGKVNLSVRDGSASLTVSGVTSTPTLMDVDDYPALGHNLTAQAATVLTVDAAAFLAAFKPAAVAADHSNTLPILEAVQVASDGATVTLSATDRFRLHETTVDVWSGDVAKEFQFLIPADAVKVLKFLTGPVAVALGHDGSADGYQPGGAVTFRNGRLTITRRLQDGEYPKVRNLWQHNKDSFVFDRDQMLNAVTVLKPHASSRNAPIRFTAADGSLRPRITGDDDQAATGPDILVGDGGTPLAEWAVNPQYLEDILKILPAGHTATFQYVDEKKPFTFTSEALPRFRALLMPVRNAS